MISFETLRKVARIKGIKNIGYAEKDYFQEIVLLVISREYPRLVFKGGTALYKFYKLDRFSEDLDFNGDSKNIKFSKFIRYFRDFGYDAKVEIDNKSKTQSLATFIIDGFLYNGSPESYARVRLSINFADSTIMNSDWLPLFSNYPDIPSFSLNIMNMEEILSEKIRALVMREKARDAYDIYFLLQKGIKPNMDMIKIKLTEKNIDFDLALIKKALIDINKIWKKELDPILISVPSFNPIEKYILKSFQSE
ncbi:MAG: nucleotidyl transferase AbiEii/AbiGii toxin family protein [Thermoplasmata archaeon]